MIEEILQPSQGIQQETEIRGRRQMLATGFASPADRFVEKRLNIHDLVVQNPTATFFFKVRSELPKSSPFLPGDILLVDRSKQVIHDCYVVATVDGEFILSHLLREQNNLEGYDLRNQSKIIGDWSVWGVILYCIRPTL